MESINKLVEVVKDYVKNNNVIIIVKLNKEKISTRFYEIKNDEEVPFRPKPKEYRDFSDELYNLYNSSFLTNDRFNSVLIEININGQYSEKYMWDSQQEKQDLLDGAEVFYQWVNERMMSMIFEYEKDNDLVPTEYDSDGDLEYLSSWDSGVFTFHIDKNNNLVYKVVLTKDGKERTLDLPLRDYFVEGILDHYKVTNNELSDDWKPWNTMILKSLHYDIPYDKREEFVNYILE
ncbi:hypothetical protein [Flavobacterium anhuiense]|uniref:hypothetical protein n=1 Tax=Flavobacterium anhuiense TaxID=459526 RepID=UPI002025F40B|nr:hypothetical protein [Flavobacterium anhuiense]URM35205.1 hypothetical protein LLY39_12150 [Flavobacterium anhuiense]